MAAIVILGTLKAVRIYRWLEGCLQVPVNAAVGRVGCGTQSCRYCATADSRARSNRNKWKSVATGSTSSSRSIRAS
jgi:hypothetical protein